MNVPEAHIWVSDVLPYVNFRRRLKLVGLKSKYRPTNDKFAEEYYYILPDGKSGQRKIGHGNNADNNGKTIQEISEMQSPAENE